MVGLTLTVIAAKETITMEHLRRGEMLRTFSLVKDGQIELWLHVLGLLRHGERKAADCCERYAHST